MTPDEHAKRAEAYLEKAMEVAPVSPARASLERRAIAHATLSLRAPKPAPRRAAKKTTTKKSTASTKEQG